MWYKNESLNVLANIFSQIDDKRDNRGKRHKLIDIFILTIFGLLWGHTDFTNMEIELKYKEKYFTDLLGLENGIPSHDTFSATFSIIDPQEFLECFIQWLVEIAESQGKHIAIDGKAIRAACEKTHRKKAPVLINAYMVESGICLAQLKVDSKSNEIKGIPEILSWLNIEGAVVTTDAIGTQKDIVSMIIEKGADFVLPVKANQENTQKDIELVMMGLVGEQELEQELAKKRKAKGKIIETSQTKKLDSFQELEKGHSRMDRRTYHVWNEGGSLVEKEWPGVKAVGMVIRERLQIHYLDNGEIDNEQPTTETQFYIMSRKMKAEEFACYTRGHWGIENGLHWVLDDVLREDRCTSRKGHSTENLCLMRKIVYNLLKLDENVDGKSVKAKQVYYRNNPDAICRLIFEIIPGSRT